MYFDTEPNLITYTQQRLNIPGENNTANKPLGGSIMKITFAACIESSPAWAHTIANTNNL